MIQEFEKKLRLYCFLVIVFQALSKVYSFISKLIHFPFRLLLQTFEAEQMIKFKKFSKRGGLDRTSTFRGGLLGKRGWLFSGGLQFLHKNTSKSEIFDDKKSLWGKIFFSVINKNSNWEIVPKNSVTFKR